MYIYKLYNIYVKNVYLCISFTAFIKQLLSDVFWENVDYLIVDTPPGTSDEHITVMENIK